MPKLALHFLQWTLAAKGADFLLATIFVPQWGQFGSPMPMPIVVLHLGHINP